MNKKITVFTPTFNRAYILKNLYESLCMQEYKNFEWLIVDDGSSDETNKIVKDWIKENKIEIRYFYQENSGKHVAINLGVKNAKGKYFIIVDSDDYLTKDALKEITNCFISIDGMKNFAGISGTKIFTNNELIGTTFEGEYVDATSLERKKFKINGDKAEVFYTDVLSKYKFPVFEDEKFMSEAYIWNKIAADGYKIRWFNKPFIVCEYLEDGLTKNKKSIAYKNIKGELLYLKDLIMFEKNFFRKIAHYASYCGLSRIKYDKKTTCSSIKINLLQYYFFILIFKIRRIKS